MLSRLHTSFRSINTIKPILVKNNTITHNFLPKRCSGHNAMDIGPNNYGYKHFKDMLHFYTVITAIPIAVISTIISVRANPELTEIPEGYEPRHWEYYKHPITRFMAKYFFKPMELDYELFLSLAEQESENMIMRKIETAVDKTMIFYNDHRSGYFAPFHADGDRIARDDAHHLLSEVITNEGHFYDSAYDPNLNALPTEGYKPID